MTEVGQIKQFTPQEKPVYGEMIKVYQTENTPELIKSIMELVKEQPKMIEIKSEHGTFRVDESLFAGYEPNVKGQKSAAPLSGHTLKLKNGINIRLKDQFKNDTKNKNIDYLPGEIDGDAVVTIWKSANNNPKEIHIGASNAHWVDIEAENGNDDRIQVSSINSNVTVFKDKDDVVDAHGNRIVVK